MKPANLLFFLSDNHARSAMGCSGNPLIQTPTLDALAARGTRFANAYTASPLCCPARASIATGRFPFQTGYWDNAIVYDGRVPSWMHRLREANSEVVSVGKLHFRSSEDDNGFSREIAPMHILNAKGGVSTLLRWSDEEPVNRGQWELYLDQSGPGQSHYQEYDTEISRLAIAWLKSAPSPGFARPPEGVPENLGAARRLLMSAPSPGVARPPEGVPEDLGAARRLLMRHPDRGERPWALLVSYVSPHPPFSVPQELLDLYPASSMPLPALFRPAERPTHPALDHLRRIMGFRAMDDEDALRRITACYYALVTHLDRQIGLVIKAAQELGLLENTRIIYTSDHGEALGAHGLFGKANLLEPGAGVPLLMCGPQVRPAHVETRVVSHVDLYPTIVEGAGLAPAPAEADLPGHSLHRMASHPTAVFAEYHAAGSRRGAFMLRAGDDKLIAHVDAPAQLFDLARDPHEAHDLARDPAAQARLHGLEQQLRTVCDPEQVDQRARADQKAKAEYWGGNAAILKEGLLVYTPPPGVQATVAAAGV